MVKEKKSSIKKNKKDSEKQSTKEELRKPNLLIATDNFLPRWDGIARFLMEILPALTEQYDVTVVSPNYGKSNHESFKHVKIPLSKISLGDYTSAKHEPKTIKKLVKNSDIVFTQTSGPIGGWAIKYAKKLKKPVAAYIHSIEWELVPMATINFFFAKILIPLMKMYSKYIYAKTNLLIVPSEDTAELLSWQGIQTQKTVVYCGVNSDLFKPLKERTDKEQFEIMELKDKLGLSGFCVIGNHGRIAREKDLYTTLRAFNWLQKKKPAIKLLIVGDGVESIKKKLKLAKNVVLVPKTNQVQKYLNLMDCYVTASLTETTSLSTLEALSSGLPVVSTRVGFIKEYVHDDYNGFLFNFGDSWQLYKKLHLLIINPELMNLVGRRARKSVQEKFRWSDTAKGVIDALKSIQ